MSFDVIPVPEVAARATNRHYDLPARAFAAFLGARMKYTCGLYETGRETLDQAQEAKLRFIARLLHVKEGARVLDIGCGWGSLSLFLAKEYGCEVVAVTPSAAQTAFVRDRAHRDGTHAHVHVVNDLFPRADVGTTPFDAAALVGVIEHMPDHVAVIKAASERLRRAGRLYISASCYRSRELRHAYATRESSLHVTDTIFGYAEMRPLSQLLAAAEDAGLSIASICDLTANYHRTVEDWQAGIEHNRASIDAAVPGMSQQLLRYLATTNAGWGYTTKHYALTTVKSRMGERGTP